MKHNLLTSANGFCTPPCLDSQRKSTISSIYSTLRTSLLALFLLIVGNSAAWADCHFTANSTVYFDLRNAAWYDSNAKLYAEFFTGSTSRGESSLLNETGTSHVYSFQIPNRDDINEIVINRYSPDGGGHQWKWGYTAHMTASAAGNNDCIYMPSWTGDPVSCNWITFGSGSITTDCGSGTPTPSPYTLRGDFWLNGSGDWNSTGSGPRFTDNDDGTASLDIIFNQQAPRITFCDGSTEKTASDIWDNSNSTSGLWNKNDGSKVYFNQLSGTKKLTLTYTSGTNKLKGTVANYDNVTAGWHLYVDDVDQGEMSASGVLDIANLSGSAGGTAHTFYITDGSATTHWGVNKFGGLYTDESNSNVTFGTKYKCYGDKYNSSLTFPIVGEKDYKGRFKLTSTSNVRFTFDGGKVTINTIAPAVTRTVTIHPNNGEANFTMNVADGGTISSIAASYGAGTASWYSDSELITPFTLGSTTVTGDMDLYAKWGVSGNYYVVGDLWMYDAGGNWDNAKAQLMTNTNGVSTVSYTAPKGLNRIEIIKDRDWGQKINGGSYSAVINASSPVSLSESGGHIVFTLTEAKRVTITFDGKVSVNATDYSFDQSVDWRVKTSDSGWGNNPNTWDHSNVMTKTTSGASIIIRNVPGSTNHSFMITRGSDEQAVVGTYNFNALWLDTSSPSTGLTWNMQNTNIGDRQLAQTDNEWRNCSFRLSEQSDVRITFDGGVIRMDILPKYTVTFDSDGGTAVASQTLYEGLAATEPGDPTKAGGFTFNYWKLSGESSEYDFSTPVTSNITLVADWTAPASLQELIETTPEGGTLTLTSNYNEDAVIDKSITINGNGHTIGNLMVEQTGDLTLSSGLTVNDFTICAKAGNTSTPAASGQVRNAANLTVNGNAYFLYTVDPSGHVQYGWYDFTVPFPVNAASGIKGIENSVLKENFANGTDYAVMEYLGEKQGQGQYPYKKFSGVMQPNKLYSITLDDDHNYNTLRMQKTADGALVAGDNVTLNAYAGDAQHQNWNGVGNGTLHHADAGVSAEYIQVYQSGNKTFLTINKSEYSFVVGTAFMVQETGTMTLNQATHDKLLAPKRYADAPATAIQIASDGQPFSDQLFISASETGGQAYTPGVDVAKAGTLGGANVPQIWTNAYNSALCVHEAQLINGEAQYDLSLYAPAAGNYTLTSKNIPADYTLYLTQNGTTLCELSETYTFDLSQGITTEYGLLLVESHKMPTGIENIQGDEVQSAKIMHNGILYILHNGKVYNAQGANVK